MHETVLEVSLALAAGLLGSLLYNWATQEAPKGNVYAIIISHSKPYTLNIALHPNMSVQLASYYQCYERMHSYICSHCVH